MSLLTKPEAPFSPRCPLDAMVLAGRAGHRWAVLAYRGSASHLSHGMDKVGLFHTFSQVTTFTTDFSEHATWHLVQHMTCSLKGNV